MNDQAKQHTPDLLEALEVLAEACQSNASAGAPVTAEHPALKNALAQISKAKGTS